MCKVNWRFNPSSARAIALLMPSLVFPSGPAASAEPGYVLPETESWQLAADGGEPYHIFVSLPEGPPPDDGYPVLYVLDGNAMFAGFAEARRIQAGTADNKFAKPNIGSSIIVGVGYETKQVYDIRRLDDFTPPLPADPPPRLARFAKYPSGGQDRFLEFLVNDLRPEIDRRYGIDPNRQALFGHSLGGLFALHVLYTQPDAFSAIIAASPALYWIDQSILAEERAFANALAQSKISGPVSRVLLLVGELEETSVLIWDTEALARRLEPLSAYGLRSQFRLLDGEVHVTVPSRAITTTLRFAFSVP